MHLRAPAILCAARAHGEHAAVLRLMTADHGLIAAYCAGARGRRLRPVVIPGNLLDVELSARSASQLPFARVELVTSRGPWLGEPLASAAIGWATALTAATLPESQPYPVLYDALGAVLEAICHAPSARGWVGALAAYQELLLRELGYGSSGTRDAPSDDWPTLLARLERQGKAIGARLLAERRGDAMGAHAILLDRLKRIAGDL
ncbi:DNA repair protein RecO [Novosphingobium tardum]|uniref:DNA repair protein RecO n=1 Tax=Novosphingobium tardum TaxID=1538021 RepID=A0ABV8RT54_9SPHN